MRCHYFTNYIFLWTSQSLSVAWSVSVSGHLAKFVNQQINKYTNRFAQNPDLVVHVFHLSTNKNSAEIMSYRSVWFEKMQMCFRLGGGFVFQGTD